MTDEETSFGKVGEEVVSFADIDGSTCDECRYFVAEFFGSKDVLSVLSIEHMKSTDPISQYFLSILTVECLLRDDSDDRAESFAWMSEHEYVSTDSIDLG